LSPPRTVTLPGSAANSPVAQHLNSGGSAASSPANPRPGISIPDGHQMSYLTMEGFDSDLHKSTLNIIKSSTEATGTFSCVIAATSAKSKRACFDYQKGECFRGESCRFRHVMPEELEMEKEMKRARQRELQRSMHSSRSNSKESNGTTYKKTRRGKRGGSKDSKDSKASRESKSSKESKESEISGFSSQAKSKRVCFDFQKGECFRSNCKFRHEMGSNFDDWEGEEEWDWGSRGSRESRGRLEARPYFGPPGVGNPGGRGSPRYWGGASGGGYVVEPGWDSSSKGSSRAHSRESKGSRASRGSRGSLEEFRMAPSAGGFIAEEDWGGGGDGGVRGRVGRYKYPTLGGSGAVTGVGSGAVTGVGAGAGIPAGVIGNPR
jgi:hypothetical protein